MVSRAARAGRYTCSAYVPGYMKIHWAAVVVVDKELTAAWNYIYWNKVNSDYLKGIIV